MDETRQAQPSRMIGPLLVLMGVILVLGLLLTQVDLSKPIGPLLAGNRSAKFGMSTVIAIMVVVFIGLPLLALGVVVRANRRRSRSARVGGKGETKS